MSPREPKSESGPFFTEAGVPQRQGLTRDAKERARLLAAEGIEADLCFTNLFLMCF